MQTENTFLSHTKRQPRAGSMRITCNTLIAVVAGSVLGLAGAASATTIFSQTPSSNSAFPSDRDSLQQYADNLTLSSPDTARSVTWRGIFGLGNNPVAPVSFDLIFYGNTTNNLPDETNVLSTTTVSFASTSDFTDTGINLGSYDIYEFHANLTPTFLPVTQVWFSVLANTSNDTNDDFYWTSGGSSIPALAASRGDIAGNGAFTSNNDGPFYFVLDDAAIPNAVPTPAAAVGGLALIGLLAASRRRGHHQILGTA